MRFTPPDFLNYSNEFTDEEKLVQKSVRSFVDNEIMPIIADCHMKGEFPKQIIKGLGELGVFGPTINGYGCPGLSHTAYGLIMQEIERCDSGIRSFVSVQGALCMYPIYKFASDEIKNQYLPKMATGELIGCFGLTEPDFGSNPSGMQCKAVKDGDSYVLNGTKMWITNGCMSDLAIVWAKNEDDKVIGFVVDKNISPYKTQEIKNKYSLRASITSELIFENVRVPASHMLNVEGLKGPFTCLNMARFGIAWGSLGAAMACYTEALEYAKTRIQFDKPIASFQLVQSKLVNMFTEITKGQLLNLQVSKLLESGDFTPQHISMAKMNNVSVALNIARVARDILGANGITYEYQTGRHMQNLESVNTYEGTEDIHRLILGQHITGIAAFS